VTKRIEEHIQNLAFDSNPVFDAVLAYLQINIESEVDRAISYSTEGEKRIHACGRAEALKDFREALIDVQQQAKTGKFGG
jgi:hypothetical protein